MAKEKEDETIIVIDSIDQQKYRIAQKATGNSKNIRIMTEQEYSSYQAKKIGGDIGHSIAHFILLYPLCGLLLINILFGENGLCFQSVLVLDI